MTKWTVINCNPDQSGADAAIRAHGIFDTEEEALEFLANIRDDNPETGDGWTRIEIDLSFTEKEVR